MGWPPAAWAAVEPVLNCKAGTQFSCSPAGCEAYDPATQNELTISLRDRKMTFCLGSACWKTVGARLGRDIPGQLSVFYDGATSLNGQRAWVHMSGWLERRSGTWRMTVMSDDAKTDVFFGDCRCEGGDDGGGEGSTGTSCLRLLSKS